MSGTSSKPIAPTEAERLKKTFQNLQDCIFNKIFALSKDGARLRGAFIGLILFVLWITLSFAALGFPSLSTILNKPINIIASLALYALLLLAPFFLAQSIAAAYLSDIFELEDEKIAARFIRQAAFGGGYQTIRISGGEIAEQHKDHPIVKIGGPGFVTVDLDSVALFEHVDGRPHVIGPGAKIPIEGFERLRETIDLRDHQTDPIRTKDRTLDGIAIGATDIRLLFSVLRPQDTTLDTSKNAQGQYAYDEEAIKRLVYRQGTLVRKKKTDDPNRRHWSGTIRGLATAELRDFINSHTLSEFFASIGAPEHIELERMADLVKEEPPFVPNPNTFVPYSTLSDQFLLQLNEKAAKMGLQLQWMGIGTWELPKQIILEHHRDAWKITRQNKTRKSLVFRQQIREEASLEEQKTLIQYIIKAFREGKKLFKEDTIRIMRQLLVSYRVQLQHIQETLEKEGEPIPEELEIALQHITSLTGYWTSP